MINSSLSIHSNGNKNNNYKNFKNTCPAFDSFFKLELEIQLTSTSPHLHIGAAAMYQYEAV